MENPLQKLKKEGENKKDNSAVDFSISTSASLHSRIEETRNPARHLKQDQLLKDILEKSHRIVGMNFELGQKLSENEKTIDDLSQDLEVLKSRLFEEQDTRKQLNELKRKIYVLAETNSNLTNDLRLLRESLVARDQYLAVLKKEFTKRLSPMDINKIRQKDSFELKLQADSLQENLTVLQNDVEEKNKHIGFLKRQLVGKQLTLFREEERKKNSEIEILSNELKEKENLILKLQGEMKKVSRMDFSDFEGLQKENSRLHGENSDLKSENLNVSGINDKMKTLLKKSAEKILEMETKISLISFENTKLKSIAEEQTKIDLANKMLAKRAAEKEISATQSGKFLKRLQEELILKSNEIKLLRTGLENSRKMMLGLGGANKRIVFEAGNLKKQLEGTKQEDLAKIKEYQEMLIGAQKSLAKYKGQVMKIKDSLGALLKNKVVSESEKQKLKAKLLEFSHVKDELLVKEQYYKQVIMSLTKKELEMSSELQVLKSKSINEETPFENDDKNINYKRNSNS